MEDEYLEDAAFLPDVDEADTAFSADFDPGEAGQPYLKLTLPAWACAAEMEPAPDPEPELVWDKPLLTHEEFMAKYGLKGQGAE
jgi:hypothetical protein